MASPASRRPYYWTFAGLLLLLAATVVAAQFDLGPAAALVAFSIAAAKAVLIAVYFMHLRHRSGVTRLFACGGWLWLALLFALTFADYLTRSGSSAAMAWNDPALAPAGAPAPLPERRRESGAPGPGAGW